MASDAHFVPRVMSAVVEAGVPFAFLHGETEAAGGKAGSDVDLAIAAPAARAACRIAETALRFGLRPVLWWPHDVGAGALFVTDPAAESGVQLDLLGVERGGKYGVLADEVVTNSVSGQVWPTADPIDSLLYQLRKRTIKGDWIRQRQVADELSRWPVDRVVERARHVFEGHAVGPVLAVLKSGPTPRKQRRPPSPAKLKRVGERLRNPVGARVQVPEQHIEEVAARLNRVLLDCRVQRRAGRAPSRVAIRIAADLAILRGSVVLEPFEEDAGFSGLPGWRGSSPNSTVEAVVHVLAERVLSRLRTASEYHC
jgi:hypothetical protein